MLIIVVLVVLSMTMATQYATTKIGYSYGIVHPSDASIRYIGSDNASTGDGFRILRVDGSNGTTAILKLDFGNFSLDYVNKTFTSAFGIVNEEPFAVNITHINVTSTTDDILQIWLHGNRDAKIENDGTSVFMWNRDTTINASSTTAWTLGRGDSDPTTMRYNVSDAGSEVTTLWDSNKHVRYSVDDEGIACGIGQSGRTSSNASDFVWVQISLRLGAATDSDTGTIYIHLEADTQWGED
jgi:hypothetical protein